MATKAIEVVLNVILFKEDNIIIAYCPALDLSGTGKTEAEAKRSFDIVFTEYLRYTLNKGTLEKDLLKHGWTKKSKTSKKLAPPTFVETLTKSKDLQRIVNNNEVKTYKKPVPAFM